MLKFYILISDPAYLFRHFSPHYSNLTPENTEVVINTKNRANERDIIELCELYGVFYHITESNGTPARGKNELLRIFEDSDNDYCVQIDGDDYLTPYGVWLYQEIASGSNVPDAICLKNQISWCRMEEMFSEDEQVELRRFFTMHEDGWDKAVFKKAFRQRMSDEVLLDKMVAAHEKYYSKQLMYCEDREAHSRVVFFSKKAAKYKFPEEHTIGEDTLQYYALKHAHMKGKLTFVCNDEAPATYVYDQTCGGTVWFHTKGHTNCDWMEKFNAAVEELEKEGTVYKKDLPLLKINYPRDFENFDDLGTAGLVTYKTADGGSVRLPANATKQSVYLRLDEAYKNNT